MATRRVKITLFGLHIYVLHIMFLLDGDVVGIYLYIQDRDFQNVVLVHLMAIWNILNNILK